VCGDDARQIRDRIPGLERWSKLDCLPVPVQAPGARQSARDLRALPAAIRLEPLVRVAGILAQQHVRGQHRRTALIQQPGRAEPFPRESIPERGTEAGARRSMAVLVHLDGGEARNRQLVEARVPGHLRPGAHERREWGTQGRRVAHEHGIARMKGRANVIGAGPNGLAAAIVLAQAGLQVEVFEAEPQPGGAARTLPLTLPGFLHDFGSAVFPMAVGSPFFNSLPLADHGLQWIHPSAPLAHPLDDGSAVILERNLEETERRLGEDGKAWRRLFAPLVEHWSALAPGLLGPISALPKHPFLMARFGLRGFQPATWLMEHNFRNQRTKALFAGLAAHSFLRLGEPLSAAFGIILAATAHAVGWPIPRGGAQSLTDALCSHLSRLGGGIKTGSRVERLADLHQSDLTMCDVTPRQLLQMAGERLSESYRRQLQQWNYGPGVFKVDYALSGPIPWRATECSRAATVHLGGTATEIAESEKAA